MLLLTRIFIGPWIRDFVSGIRAYKEYSSPVWPPSLLSNPVLIIILLIGLITWGLWFWRNLKRINPPERGGWIIAFSSLLALVLFPQTGNYSLIMGLIAAWFVLWVNDAKPVVWMLVLLVLTLPWFFQIFGESISDWEHLLIPLSLMALLTFSWLKRGSELTLLLRDQSQVIEFQSVDG
jgi:hypothetical protein